MAPIALLEARGISKTFGKVRALHRVDFHINPQEIVGLVGDNGAGKSTLIKILTGVYPPDEGEIYFQGHRVHFSSPKDARALGIETVYQDLALIEQMSIARNFFLGSEIVRRLGILPLLDSRAMEATTEEVLRGLGITSLRSADEEVRVLSGGERQAIAIGRTLHFGAKLLILDEPTSALSIVETQKVLGYIQEAKRRGLSVIFITHNLYHVYPVADRIVVLEHGKKVGDLRKEEASLEDIVNMIAYGGTQA
ncbi:MAG: ATP-binding cassette domain-containing protein [Armatimonadota bacterium]|nr:ATP-binding cassette domain-containing protein [Armatimonadota bacterium]